MPPQPEFMAFLPVLGMAPIYRVALLCRESAAFRCGKKSESINFQARPWPH